jgi:hypothetical protein
MDLNFGHGFIPRIGSQNYKAGDRCLGPDSLFDAPVDLPWAIVEAPWAVDHDLALVPLDVGPDAAPGPRCVWCRGGR